jgi:ketosteroid isomerase-like protein
LLNHLSSRRVVGLSFAALILPFGAPQSAAAAGGGKSSWNRPADTRAILAIENKLADSALAPELGNTLSDEVVLLEPNSSDPKRGKAAVLRSYREHKDALGGAKGRYLEISIVTTPNFACSASQIRYETKKPGGGASPTELRKLDAFKKVGGRWRLIQQHISAATDRETGHVTEQPLVVRGPLTWKNSTFNEAADDPKASTQAILQWTEHALLEPNLTSAMLTIAPGKDVMIYPEFQPANLRGRDEVAAYWGPLYNSFDGLHVSNPLLLADSDGLLGAQVDTQDITIDMKDGSKPQISIRQSDCLRQYDGNWHTFLEAVSYAVDKSTGKAVIRNPTFSTR